MSELWRKVRLRRWLSRKRLNEAAKRNHAGWLRDLNGLGDLVLAVKRHQESQRTVEDDEQLYAEARRVLPPERSVYKGDERVYVP